MHIMILSRFPQRILLDNVVTFSWLPHSYCNFVYHSQWDSYFCIYSCSIFFAIISICSQLHVNVQYFQKLVFLHDMFGIYLLLLVSLHTKTCDFIIYDIVYLYYITYFYTLFCFVGSIYVIILSLTLTASIDSISLLLLPRYIVSSIFSFFCMLS